MHEYAEYGVAAHWNYKEQNGKGNGSYEMYSMLRKLVEHKDIEDPAEFLDAIKGELISNLLYVFTPGGDLIELQQGATPVDFAYAIHSDIGDHCSRAMVNRTLVPLDYKLKTGDTVEITINKEQKPNRDWLSFVVTSKAKTKIRSWLRTLENKKAEEIGKSIAERKLRNKGININDIFKKDKLTEIFDKFELNNLEELYRAVGFGNISINDLIKFVKPETELHTADKAYRIDKIIKNIRKDEMKDAVLVKGFNDIMTRFAKCCSPLPGESISGYITRGKGITIHKNDCPHLLEVDPQRKIEVEWDKNFNEQMPAKIFVECIDKPGILSKLTKTISSSDVNILRVEMDSIEIEKAKGVFNLTVDNVNQLIAVIESLKKVKGVLSVDRIFDKSQEI